MNLQIMSKKGNTTEIKQPKIVYDYNEWREKQRNQLSESSNIFFLFASAQLGFIISFIPKEIGSVNGCCIKFFFFLTSILLFVSLVLYGLLALNRLKDFRKTARLINDGKSTDEISASTEDVGQLTWTLFYLQLGFLAAGTLVTIVFYLSSFK